jgi:hypothetical protein
LYRQDSMIGGPPEQLELRDGDVDHHAREALLAIDPFTRRGVAVVRYIQLPGEPGVVELAATVADDWQGIGLGSALLACASTNSPSVVDGANLTGEDLSPVACGAPRRGIVHG